MEKIEFLPLGDCGVTVRLGSRIDPSIHHKVKALTQYLEEHPFLGMVELVPGFASVSVFYDLIQVLHSLDKDELPYEKIVEQLKMICSQLTFDSQKSSRVVEIPVCYGGEFGPDLEYVAQYSGLTPDEVIRIHSQKEYLVYMIGFAPGFPYLGGMDPRIAVPRRDSPRLTIPMGSVGIGGEQTGVYPIASPGGWQLIGRTPEKLFRPQDDPPSLLQAGDLIRFCPITEEEYVRGM